MVTTWLAAVHVRTSQSHDDRLQDAPTPHTNTHTYIHTQTVLPCAHRPRRHTTAALEAVGPVTVAAEGEGGRGDRAVTSELKASSGGVHKTPTSSRWSC